MIETEVNVLDEAHFVNTMEQTVHPLLRKIGKSGTFSTLNKETIYYEQYDHPEEKGTIVISHGFCEFTKKYEEVIYSFYQAGYSVYIMDHLGHGYSSRRVEDKSMVHISSYNEYVSSFHTFIQTIVLKDKKERTLILFSHSMGGAISALYLEKYPSVFSCAIFSSPMLEIDYGKNPFLLVWFLMKYKKNFGAKQEYIIGSKAFDSIPYFEKSSCLSKARFYYFFNKRVKDEHYQTFGGSYLWGDASINAIKNLQKNASKISTPILLLQASEDTTVKPGGQIKFSKKSQHTQLTVIQGSKHEIFNATFNIREKYYHEIFTYLNKK